MLKGKQRLIIKILYCMKKEITFWIGASAVSTIIVAAHPDVDFKQMILVAMLAIVLWLCGYVFERSLAQDPWRLCFGCAAMFLNVV